MDSYPLFYRGAELIEELRIKDVKLEVERESQILQKIKMKMDRIKATQQKILEPVHEPTTHAKGNFCSDSSENLRSCFDFCSVDRVLVSRQVCIERKRRSSFCYFFDM